MNTFKTARNPSHPLAHHAISSSSSRKREPASHASTTTRHGSRWSEGQPCPRQRCWTCSGTRPRSSWLCWRRCLRIACACPAQSRDPTHHAWFRWGQERLLLVPEPQDPPPQQPKQGGLRLLHQLLRWPPPAYHHQAHRRCSLVCSRDMFVDYVFIYVMLHGEIWTFTTWISDLNVRELCVWFDVCWTLPDLFLCLCEFWVTVQVL
jgi:hypothetical protein